MVRCTRPTLSTVIPRGFLAMSRSESTGVTLQDLPKSNVFTTKLPPDPQFPTPESSAEATRSDLGPRMVKGALYTYVRPDPVEDSPELLAVSPLALRSLGLAHTEPSKPEFLKLVSGNGAFEDKSYPWAQCYGGWQFGQWAGQLGDGRAISLFEATNPETKKRYELQLKGAGQTPYSRFADGKAVLRSSIREFIVSEYLYSIGIPTTRALSLTLLPGNQAIREKVETCAIVCRFAESWIRIGTFDLLRARGDRKNLRLLSDYVREEVLDMKEKPQADGSNGSDGVDGARVRNRYEDMYREIVRRNALTVAKWQAYGFMNGVLNTDNTSVMGLSLDFGPFSFMDTFNPKFTPNHDDHMLRYCYRNQPTIIWWNLVRLAEDLAELFAATPEMLDSETFINEGLTSEADAEALIKRAENIIREVGEEFKSIFLTEYKQLMAARLGFIELRETDMDDVYSPLLDTLEDAQVDFGHFFRRLSDLPIFELMQKDEEAQLAEAEKFMPKAVLTTVQKGPEKILKWLKIYAERLEENEDSKRMERMKKVNPKFIPKNWVLEEIIQRVGEKGDREVLGDVTKLIENPFANHWEEVKDAERWCGDVPRLEVGLQCSCSS
ncbi:UPF0061-domain-containing protein [Choiromyces venosus 120613-1]|uniref:Selenoprotein O n=1 Tax=Choiromyces venosus 120613-1 TaxID=1336337 RepID=A0A3N4J9U4_9PEZI|nr:UPF0061-domain-containing protein [Choiromyces venosus 120613-1]